MKHLVAQIADFENEYGYAEEIAFNKFIKHHGQNYTQEEFIKFLKRGTRSLTGTMARMMINV